MNFTTMKVTTTTIRYDDDDFPTMTATSSLPDDIWEFMTEGFISAGSTVASKSVLSSSCGYDAPESIPSLEFPPTMQPFSKSSKSTHHKRARSFKGYVDPDCRMPASKKASTPKTAASKEKARTPLGIQRGSGNSTPSVSPRDPDMPFTFNRSDPFWTDSENHVPYTPYTPAPASSRPQEQPHSRTQPQRRSVPRVNNRREHNRREHNGNTASHVVSSPRSMVLYDQLEIKDWTTCMKNIKVAFRKVARRCHPDKVAHEEKAEAEAEATKQMQRILAAKGVLLDHAKRRKYDVDGVLPPTWPFDG